MNVFGIHVPGTVLEGIFCLVGALIFWRFWPTKHWGDVITAVLGMTGSCDLLGTAPARWIHSLITSINDVATRWFVKWGGAGSTAVGALALIAIILLLVAWHPRGKIKAKANWVLAIALLLPLVVSMIPGTAGDWSTRAVIGIANATNYPFSHWLGV